MEAKKNLLSKLPAVDEMLNNNDIKALIEAYPRKLVVAAIREEIGIIREQLQKDYESFQAIIEIDINELVKNITKKIYVKTSRSLKKVVNATGIVLHTNMGRAVLSKAAAALVVEVATNYSNLEMNINTGLRGSRYSHVEELICSITGAEAALVVNNNAAAVMLILDTIAYEKEVIVSRGELIEIGGSFRIPDVMHKSGARLKEIGTTNKTHLGDYKNALNENTGAIMKIHTSNYKICGFTEDVKSNDLALLGKEYNIPIIEDLGSGLLIDASKYGLPYEPTVQCSVKFGVDIICFSGDKMLGGPQAGIIIGKKTYIEKMKKNQLLRALRIDKLTLAALEGVLRLYLDEEKIINNVPVLQMLTYSSDELKNKAKKLYGKLKELTGKMFQFNIEDSYSEVGGGAMPLSKLPTKVVSVAANDISINRLEEFLRKYNTPVIARIWEDKILLDVRTIFETEFNVIAEALSEAAKSLNLLEI